MKEKKHNINLIAVHICEMIFLLGFLVIMMVDREGGETPNDL